MSSKPLHIPTNQKVNLLETTKTRQKNLITFTVKNIDCCCPGLRRGFVVSASTFGAEDRRFEFPSGVENLIHCNAVVCDLKWIFITNIKKIKDIVLAAWPRVIVSGCHRGDWSYGLRDRYPPGCLVVA
jgi:hypothetical protein